MQVAILTIRPGSEFNIVGAPSEELKRHLLYLATIDSDAVHSGYKSPNSVHADAESRNAEQADAFLSFAQLVMANQTRIDVLSDELNRLDDASYQALIETEERLERAREELERIRAQAYEITLPDGTVVKVYRDSDAVRGDTGSSPFWTGNPNPRKLPAGRTFGFCFKTRAPCSWGRRPRRKPSLFRGNRSAAIGLIVPHLGVRQSAR